MNVVLTRRVILNSIFIAKFIAYFVYPTYSIKFRFYFDDLNYFALSHHAKLHNFIFIAYCAIYINIISRLKMLIKKIIILLSLIISLMTTHTHVGHANGLINSTHLLHESTKANRP